MNEIVGGKPLTAIFIVVTLITIASGFMLPTSPIPDEVEIPVMVDLTGPNAHIGTEVAKGVELAVEALNGSIVGPRFSAEFYDTGSDIDKAVEMFRLIEASGSPVVIGPTTTEEAEAINALGSDIICISPSVTSGEIADYPNYYRTVCTDKSLDIGIVKLINGMDCKNIAILYEGGWTYSEGHMKNVLELMGEHPDKVVTPIDTNDRGAAIERLIELSPDVVFAPMISPEAFIEVYGKATDAGLECYCITTDRMMVDEVASEFENILMMTSVRNVSDPWYIQSYERAYGKLEYTEAVYGYDTMILISEVISSEGYTPELIKGGLDKIRFIGATGMIKFDEKGDVLSSFELFMTKDGKWQMLGWREFLSF